MLQSGSGQQCVGRIVDLSAAALRAKAKAYPADAAITKMLFSCCEKYFA
jgi:hypothetical protein